MTVSVRRIREGEGLALRAARLAALADQPGEATITLAKAQARTEDQWAEAAVANSSGGVQATFFAEVDDAAIDPGAGAVVVAVPGTAGGAPIVGLVGAYANQDGVVNLVGLWSAPGFRDVGVADALLAATTDWARDAGAVRLRRWVVERNVHARAFYERLGFTATGSSMPYEPDPRLDQVEMVLVL